MISTASLYDIAELENIPVADMLLQSEKVVAISVCDDNGDCFIALDNHKILNDQEHKVSLAHELGHCMTGAFYNRYSRHNVVSKQEYTADKWAIQKLIPIDELKDARQSGATEAWELAERFGVTEDFIRRAVYIYKAMGEL